MPKRYFFHAAKSGFASCARHAPLATGQRAAFLVRRPHRQRTTPSASKAVRSAAASSFGHTPSAPTRSAARASTCPSVCCHNKVHVPDRFTFGRATVKNCGPDLSSALFARVENLIGAHQFQKAVGASEIFLPPRAPSARQGRSPPLRTYRDQASGCGGQRRDKRGPRPPRQIQNSDIAVFGHGRHQRSLGLAIRRRVSTAFPAASVVARPAPRHRGLKAAKQSPPASGPPQSP